MNSHRLPHIFLFFLTLLCAPLAAHGVEPSDHAVSSGQGAFTTVTTCAPLSAQLGTTREQVSAKLVEQGKPQALDNFFHRLYAPGKDRKLPHMTPGFIAHVRSLVRAVGSPSLFNGKELGQLCVENVYSLPQHVFLDLQMRRMELKNFCYTAPDLTLEAMRTKARLAAMDRLLLQLSKDYTALDTEQRHLLLHDLHFDERFDWFGNDLCMDVRADVIPMQIQREIAKALGRIPDVPPASIPKVAYQLDLDGLDSGDLVPEFGNHVGLFTDFQGKCLGSTSPKGATASFSMLAEEDFDLRLYVANVFDLPQKPGKSSPFPLFTLRYENGLTENYSIKAGYDDNLSPQAVYQAGAITTNTMPWINAANFNEYRLIKRKSLMKFFVNGRFIFYFTTSGDNLTTVRLPLPWKARLYDLVVTQQPSANQQAGPESASRKETTQ